MTTQMLQSPSHFPSPSSPSTSTFTSSASSVTISCSLSSPHNDVPSHQHTLTNHNPICPSSVDVHVEEEEEEQVGLGTEGGEINTKNTGEEEEEEREGEGDQPSLLELLVTVFRKSLVVGGCSVSERDIELYSKMKIGSPRNVRHVAHVTFDRFNGFLGLPDEFEPEVQRRPPSASAKVFGVSTESMQLSFDSRGNSVPTILLMMQRRLYDQQGLQAEGIFRINADNSQEEYVREQLNKGVVPDGVDVHSLAGLIKAWFRELPKGVLDPLSPDQVMQSQSEKECAQLVRLLPSTEAALLDWAINLMADVAQLENLNKMNAHNVAMVFAPNMTHMSDPLSALRYVVQVMNFLKTLVIKTLREREDSIVEKAHASRIDPSDENGHGSSSLQFINEATVRDEEEHVTATEEPALECHTHFNQYDSTTEGGNGFSVDNCCNHEVSAQVYSLTNGFEENDVNGPNEACEKNYCEFIPGQSRKTKIKKGSKKAAEWAGFRATGSAQKTKGTDSVSLMSEQIEAWR